MAITGLNGFQLADRVLLVQRASTGRQQTSSFGTGANAGPAGVPNLRALGESFAPTQAREVYQLIIDLTSSSQHLEQCRHAFSAYFSRNVIAVSSSSKMKDPCNRRLRYCSSIVTWLPQRSW